MATVHSDTQREYGSILKKYRQERSKDSLANCFPWQTRLASLELLRLAEDEATDVRILSGTATENFYCGEIADRIASVLKRETCNIKMLVWNTAECVPGNTLSTLAARYKERFELKIAGTRENGEKIPHFMLVDESAYRLEAPHPYMDKCAFSELSPETKARICFNDREGGSVLLGFFEKLWSLSEVAVA